MRIAPILAPLALASFATTALASEPPATESGTEDGPAAVEVADDTAHASPTAHASESDVPAIGITPSASFVVRYERRLGQMEGEERDATLLRARFGLHTTPIPLGDAGTMRLHFVPQAVGALTGSGASSTTGQPLHLHNGYIELSLADDHVGMDVGRFTMRYGDTLMIGHGGWAIRGRAHDGARIRTRLDNGLAIDGFATMVRETVELPVASALPGGVTGTSSFAPDIWLAGVYVQLADAIDVPVIDAIDLYELSRILPTRTYDGEELTGAMESTTGARVVLAPGPARIRVEGGVQRGRRPVADVEVDARAWQVDGDVSFALLDDALRLTAGGFYASGDDPTTDDVDEGWFEYYPSGHRWLGFMNVVRPRTDVRGAVGRIDAHIGEHVSVFEHVHWFQHAEAVDGDHGYGTEFDTGVEVHAGEHLGVAFEYDLFVPDDGDEAIIRYTEVQLSAHF